MSDELDRIDAAVAELYGHRWKRKHVWGVFPDRIWLTQKRRWFEPTRDLVIGAAIIEHERIQVGPLFRDGFQYGEWQAVIYAPVGRKRVIARADGKTMLVAAMKCLLSAKTAPAKRKSKGTDEAPMAATEVLARQQVPECLVVAAEGQAHADMFGRILAIAESWQPVFRAPA